LLALDFRKELWEAMQWTTPTFTELGLPHGSSNAVVCDFCPQHQLVLVPANRNSDDAESLEVVIRTRNTADSLPVLTLADADRVLREKSYAERVADRLLEYAFDIERYRGTGRLYLP